MDGHPVRVHRTRSDPPVQWFDERLALNPRSTYRVTCGTQLDHKGYQISLPVTAKGFSRRGGHRRAAIKIGNERPGVEIVEMPSAVRRATMYAPMAKFRWRDRPHRWAVNDRLMNGRTERISIITTPLLLKSQPSTIQVLEPDARRIVEDRPPTIEYQVGFPGLSADDVSPLIYAQRPR